MMNNIHKFNTTTLIVWLAVAFVFGMGTGVLIKNIQNQPTTPEWTEKWECVEWSEVCYCSVHDINCTNVVCPCIKQQLVRVRAND